MESFKHHCIIPIDTSKNYPPKSRKTAENVTFLTANKFHSKSCNILNISMFNICDPIEILTILKFVNSNRYNHSLDIHFPGNLFTQITYFLKIFINVKIFLITIQLHWLRKKLLNFDMLSYPGTFY